MLIQRRQFSFVACASLTIVGTDTKCTFRPRKGGVLGNARMSIIMHVPFLFSFLCAVQYSVRNTGRAEGRETQKSKPFPASALSSSSLSLSLSSSPSFCLKKLQAAESKKSNRKDATAENHRNLQFSKKVLIFWNRNCGFITVKKVPIVI